MIEVTTVLDRYEADGAFPLLTLAEFFDGNEAQDSIAPNQWGYGRPELTEIRRRVEAAAAADDVAWVRVQLHPDTSEEDGLAAESIVLCTSAALPDLEERLDTDSLQSDGVIDGLTDEASDIPEVPAGFRLTSLVWD